MLMQRWNATLSRTRGARTWWGGVHTLMPSENRKVGGSTPPLATQCVRVSAHFWISGHGWKGESASAHYLSAPGETPGSAIEPLLLRGAPAGWACQSCVTTH